MRAVKTKQGIRVNAIGGSHVVILGMDASSKARKGLLGFAFHREDHTENEAYWLRGFKTFEATDPTPKPGSLVSTQEHPIQDFHWGDYTAKPDHNYTYTVVPVYGQPKNLVYGKPVVVSIQTCGEDHGVHAIYFNRGVAGSQAYARKFGNKKPSSITDAATQKRAYEWLSRGLEEAILSFIGSAKSSKYSLRASVYEFSWLPVLEAFKKASKAGADVKIVYDRRTKGPWEATEAAAKKAGIKSLMIPRTEGKSYISHNKFIVLLKDDKPIEVWTGSTNFTEGGIFGQSNVGHHIKDPDVAQGYLDYWQRLSENPKTGDLRKANVEATPDMQGAPEKDSINLLFSPRTTLSALEWYADRLDKAKNSVGFTAAFGISGTLSPVLEKKKPYLRHVMVEQRGNKRKPRATPENPNPRSQAEIFDAIRAIKNNRIAIGSYLRNERVTSDEDNAVGAELHRWLAEGLTGLNVHVKYLHTKYMILDSIGERPVVISGSANFSAASTKNNDENMVIIEGNQNVGDTFFGEFMRLFDHFYFREIANRLSRQNSGDSDVRSPYLKEDDSWTKPHFSRSSTEFLERLLFSGQGH